MRENKVNTPVAEEVAKAPMSARRFTVIAVSIALIIAILLAGIWGIVYYMDNNASYSVDYLNDDLSRYLTITPSDYKGYTIEIDVPSVTDDDVQNVIIKRLADKKGALMYDGHYVTNIPIAAGDLAYLRYIGYTYDENGVRVDLDMDEYSNFTESKGTEFEIGGLNFPVSTVEYKLIGKKPSEYGKFSTVQSGDLSEGDVAYCTVSFTTEEGGAIYTNYPIRIDLSDENLEYQWGIDIKNYLLERKIGITDFDPQTFYRRDSESGNAGEAVFFTSFRVDYVTRCEDSALTVEAKVPYDHEDETIRGKTVYFDIFIEKTLCYERAELNDTFITESLGYSVEDLAQYEGETLTDKYKAMIRYNLEIVYEENCKYAAEDAMWNYLKQNVTFKKLPQAEVSRVFDNYYYNLQLGYSANTSYYASLDAYICASYGLEEYEDWRDHLTKLVEDEIKERLIFYSIIRAEGLVPTEEEYPEIYRKELEADFAYYGKTRDDFSSDEEYEKALADYEKEILDYYGEEFYRESVYYNYASEKMVAFANVVNVADEK